MAKKRKKKSYHVHFSSPETNNQVMYIAFGVITAVILIGLIVTGALQNQATPDDIVQQANAAQNRITGPTGMTGESGENELKGTTKTSAIRGPSTREAVIVSTPQNLIATYISSTKIRLSWNAPKAGPAVSAYEIYKNEKLLNTTTNTFYSDAIVDLKSPATYFVKTKDIQGGISQPSNKASISGLIGEVVDASSKLPIQNISVSVKVGTANATTNTDAAGAYIVNIPKPGNYQVTYSSNGYMTQTKWVSISANKLTTQKVYLTKK